MLQFLNIKAWLLALTLVAGWIAGQPDALHRFAIVAPVMLVFAFASNFAYALAGALLRHWLAQGRACCGSTVRWRPCWCSRPGGCRRMKIKDETLGMWLGVLGVAFFAVTLPMTRLATGTQAAPQLSPWFVTLGPRGAGGRAVSDLPARDARAACRSAHQWKPLGMAVLGNAIGYPLLLAYALRVVTASHAAVITALLAARDRGLRRLGAAPARTAGLLALRHRGQRCWWWCSRCCAPTAMAAASASNGPTCCSWARSSPPRSATSTARRSRRRWAPNASSAGSA